MQIKKNRRPEFVEGDFNNSHSIRGRYEGGIIALNRMLYPSKAN